MLLRYDGPGRLLRIPGKKDTPVGQTVVVSKDVGARLLANPSLNLTIADETVIPAESPDPVDAPEITADEQPAPETTEPNQEEGN